MSDANSLENELGMRYQNEDFLDIIEYID